ncbi:PorV/PorQ family protein [bacterium]|nr:PorV/PorQ family protein [bacterium]
MMRRENLLPIICLVCLLGMPLIAQSAHDAGSDSALYLGTGARAVAMGQAGVTFSDSGFTANWNPGALGFVPKITASLQHASLFGDALHESLGFVYPTLDWGSASVTLARLEVGGIERRDTANLPSGNFGMIEQQLLAAYGYNIWGPVALGAALRIHDLRLDGRVGTAPGMDAGILFKQPITSNPLKEIRLGVSCRNAISPMIRLKDETDRLFAVYRLGGGASMELIPDFPDQLKLHVEAEKPERSDIRWHAGMEYTLYTIFSLRGGWDHEYFSTGLGVTYLGITLDYAVSFPAIGMRHLATLSFAFGHDIETRKAHRVANEEKRRQAVVRKLKEKIIQEYRREAENLAAKQQFDEAAKLWEKVLDWDPEDAEAKQQLAHAHKEVIRLENARDLKSANTFMRKKHYIDVMVECQRVLERDPKNQIAKALYAQAEKKARKLGTFSLTTNVKMLEKIRQEYRLGLTAYTRRDYKKAVQHWETVIKTTPLQKQVYRYLQAARSRIMQAQKPKIRTVVKTESKQQKMYKEAVSLSRSGKLKEAVRSWENLVKENPTDKDAAKNLNKTRQNLIESQKKGIRW